MNDQDGVRTTSASKANGTSREREDKNLTLAVEHLTLLATVVGALIFAIRCVFVTQGDLYTASLLLSKRMCWAGRSAPQ
jgi:hypothetical protein